MKFFRILIFYILLIIAVLSFAFCSLDIIDYMDSKDTFDFVMLAIGLLPGIPSALFAIKTYKSLKSDGTIRNRFMQSPDLTPKEPDRIYESENSHPVPDHPTITTNNVNGYESISEKSVRTVNTSVVSKDDIQELPKWNISVSFGKSSSQNFGKAIALAKMAPEYIESEMNGSVIYQAIYSKNPQEYLQFIMLYELVSSWKSSFVMINGRLVDRKIVSGLNYCYGDRCRSGKKDFCYGASYMTVNPFGCHRLQISACNNPWWTFYQNSGTKWYLEKNRLLERIESYSKSYCYCPVFDYDQIISVVNNFPPVLSDNQIRRAMSEGNFSGINILK